MDNDFSYLSFMEILKKCREVIADDTLKKDSTDLYDALYSDVNSEAFKLKIELYELEWIELHWEMALNNIENQDLTHTERKELVSVYAKWYSQFVSEWNHSEFDMLIFQEKEKILRTLILVNSEWEQNLKRMKVSFEQSKKRLNARIKKLEGGFSLCQ